MKKPIISNPSVLLVNKFFGRHPLHSRENFIVLILFAVFISVVICCVGGYFVSKQAHDTQTKTVFPTQRPPFSVFSPTLQQNNHLTDFGYQNNEMGFSLEFQNSWEVKEEDYRGSAKSLRLSNKELEIAIDIIYMKRGSEGSTGPSSFDGEMIKKGSFILAGKTVDRFYNISKDEKGINNINYVYYTDPTKDDLDFFLNDLQFTVRIDRFMNEDYHLGKPLTFERIQKAEKILKTLKMNKL